jgi:hypothetical protein
MKYNAMIHLKMIDYATVENAHITIIIWKELLKMMKEEIYLKPDWIFDKDFKEEEWETFFERIMELVNIVIYTIFDNARNMTRKLYLKSTDPENMGINKNQKVLTLI